MPGLLAYCDGQWAVESPAIWAASVSRVDGWVIGPSRSGACLKYATVVDAEGLVPHIPRIPYAD